MLRYDIEWHSHAHPLSKKITLFVGSILLTNIVVAHKCYVCGPNHSDLIIDFIPTCERFIPNDPKYNKECPPYFRGCSIQTNGTIITRTCEEIAVQDCKRANNVEYCYCTAELCNKYHPTHIDDEDSEPESESEGSGQKHDVSGIGVVVVPVLTDVTRVLDATPTTTMSSHAINLHLQLDHLLIYTILFCFTGTLFDSCQTVYRHF